LRKNDYSAISALVSTCVGLEYLNLTSCRELSDVAFKTIVENCPALNHIVLSGCVRLTDVSWYALAASLINPGHLSLKWCKIADTALSAVLTAASIHTLNLSFCKSLTDAAIYSVCAVADLQDLDISYCSKLTGDALAALCARCTSLHRLSLEYCNPTDLQSKPWRA
jgi:F-box/leucine-rich repeat protein 14